MIMRYIQSMSSLFTPKNSVPGYYHLSIHPNKTNIKNSKALFLSLLQEYLSPRLRLTTNNSVMYQYSKSIDLIAFTLEGSCFELVCHCTNKYVLLHFLGTIKRDYCFHAQDECEVSTKKLKDIEAVLSKTLQLHSKDLPDRYNQYSSIGFYLHDRRGDWMRLWHVAELFQDLQNEYRSLLRSTTQQVAESDASTHELSQLPAHQQRRQA